MSYFMEPMAFSPSEPPEPDPVDKHGIRWTSFHEMSNYHIAYVGAPSCPWDGSAMPYVIEARGGGWDPPYPAYLFECTMCSWEDEIS